MASLTKVKLNNIDSSVTFVYDPLILVNYGATLANTDIGFVFNRDGGVNSNVAVYWNETTDRVTIAYTNATGLPNSNIAISKFANVAADWYFGNLAGGTTNTVWVSANVLPTANAFYNFGSPTQRWNVGYFAATTLDLGGSQISVDPTNGFKFTVGGTGTPTYLASNGLIAGSSLTSAGAITAGGAINTSANVLASQVSAGSVVTTGVVNAGGNVLATTGIFNLLDVNGNVEIGAVTVPGAGHTIIGNVTQTGAGTIFYNTPGNVMAAVGRFGQISSDGFINTSANISAAVGRFGSITSTGFINTSANISAATYIGGTVFVSSVLNTAGNVLTSQITVFGNATIGAVTTAGVVHDIVGNVRQSGAGTIFFNTPGNVMAAVGQFGAINSSGFINTSANVSTAQLNAGQINTTGNVLATGGVFNLFRVNHQLGGGNSSSFNDSVTTAPNSNQTLKVNGGNQYLFFNANLGAGSYNPFTTVNDIGLIFSGFAGQGTGNLLIAPWSVSQAGIRIIGTTGLVQIPGQLTINANNSPTAIALGGTSGVGNIGVSGTPFNTAFLTTVNATGNVLAAAGTFNGLTVNGIINTSGNIIASTVDAGSFESTGVIYANGTAAATSTSTGAIITAGGIAVSKDSFFNANVTIEGNLFINGNVSVFNTNNLSINDSLIYLADDNTADTLDIGFVSSFTNPGYQHTGFARDASDGIWKLFANVVPEPTTTIDFTNATYSNLLIGNLLASQVTVTGLNSAGFINTSGNVSAAIHTGGQVSVTGFINTAGNVSAAIVRAGQINTTGNVLALNVLTNFVTADDAVIGNISAAVFGNTGATFTGATLTTTSYANIGGPALFSSNVGVPTVQINGTATKGGVGYHDFLSVTNLGGGTNPNKFFRLNSTGDFEVVNSAYTAVIASLADDGRFTVFGNINVGSLTIPGAKNVFNGNVETNAIGFLQVPAGTTLQRPTSGNVAGMIRFNLDTNSFEGYSNVWSAIGGGGAGGTPGGVSTTLQYNAGGAFGGIATMNYIVANGAIIISTGTTSTSASTGALQIIGGVGITENINTTGSISTSGLINTSANISASQVSAGSVRTTGVINAGGNLLAQTAILNFLDVNGNIVVGDVGTPGAGHSIIGNVTQSGAGTIFYNTTGNILASEAKFATLGLTGTLSSSAFINTSANVSAATVIAGAVTATGTITAGFFNTAGNIAVNNGIFNTLAVNGTVGTNLNPTTSNAYTLGSSTNWWSKVWSVAVNAQYADLAETYSSDRDYVPGTVLVFGGSHEVTISTQSHDTAVAGVVSTNPAYHMNAAAEGIAVALTGRVPTKVKGPVRKGDRLVTSSIQGAAERLDMSLYQPGCIIGKALEDIADDSIQTIEVVVGRV